jgi:hypothetical protein
MELQARAVFRSVLVGWFDQFCHDHTRLEVTLTMRKRTLFDSLASVEKLDLRLSPSSLVSGAALGAVASHQVRALDDDPLPDPEPSPGPYPGGEPPITHPELPPTGPVGPGSS